MKPEEGTEEDPNLAEEEPEDGNSKKKEEKEMSGTGNSRVEKEYDLASSLSTLGNGSSSQEAAAAKAAVSISPTDLQCVTDECDLTKEQAESLLRKYNGDLKAALQAHIEGL
jgi:hypothetical protein